MATSEQFSVGFMFVTIERYEESKASKENANKSAVYLFFATKEMGSERS